ncbi:hypothetical protein C8J56DRAFT_1093410, partial [Mycena floridula]
AQGLHVIPYLLAPAEDGTPSPYGVRDMTSCSKVLSSSSVCIVCLIIVLGSFDDIEHIKAAYKGCYGCFVNTDTLTLGEEKEIYWSVKLFEYAKRAPTMRHSGLDYCSKLEGYDMTYKAEHCDGKDIFNVYLKGQPSLLDNGLSWTNIVTGVYMEML